MEVGRAWGMLAEVGGQAKGQCRPGWSPRLLGTAGSGEFQAGKWHVFSFSKKTWLLCREGSVQQEGGLGIIKLL